MTLLVLDAILLMVVVLLQAGKGGGLAAMGAAGAGSDTLFGGRQAANLLTKATWWTGGIFLTLAFILSLLATRTSQSESILRSGAQPVTAPTTTSGVPGATPIPGTTPAIPGTTPTIPGTTPAPSSPEAGTAEPVGTAPPEAPAGQ